MALESLPEIFKNGFSEGCRWGAGCLHILCFGRHWVVQQAEQGCLISNFVGLFDDTVYGQQWIDKRIGNALMQCECFRIWLWWWQVPHKSVWWCGGPPKWDPGQTCQERWMQEEQEQLTCLGNSNLVTDSCQLHKQAGTQIVTFRPGY